MPENLKNNELIRQDSLVDKLQAMHVTNNSEERKEAQSDGLISNPQFLPIEMTGDTLEELARIDAELAKDGYDDSRNSESSTFVRCNINII